MAIKLWDHPMLDFLRLAPACFSMTLLQECAEYSPAQFRLQAGHFLFSAHQMEKVY